MLPSDVDVFSDAFSAGGARLCVNAAFGLGYNGEFMPSPYLSRR